MLWVAHRVSLAKYTATGFDPTLVVGVRVRQPHRDAVWYDTLFSWHGLEVAPFWVADLPTWHEAVNAASEAAGLEPPLRKDL